MDHKYAIKHHIAEAYLLDELSEAERDEFEEHLFACVICAENVTSCDEFIMAARMDELHSQPRQSVTRRDY